MTQPIMPNPYPRGRGSRWSLPVLAIGAAVALIWRRELGGYGIAVVCLAAFMALVLDQLSAKRAR